MARTHDRALHQPRPVEWSIGFQRNAEGSVLYRAGGTVVLCTVSVGDDLPKWLGDRPGGWLTAEYQMHPRSSPVRRESREGRDRPLKGRTQEIQRLVGRALRAALDLEALGRRNVTVDCDVLEADGGTRTASVTAGFVALAAALWRLGLTSEPGRPLLRDQVAAVSVGLVNDEVRVDLDYGEDSQARVDMNVVGTGGGRLVEVQGTAEGLAIERRQFESMLDAALGGIGELVAAQQQALSAAGVELARLMGAPHGA